MRTLALLAATLLVAAGGAYVGMQLARREAPTPQAIDPATLSEPVYARVPVRVETAAEQPASPAGLEERWSQLNTMAIRALEAGHLERAVAFFQQCAEGVPDEPVFRRNLAEALTRRAMRRRERERPCPACIEDLERAVELAPERPELAELLERWRNEAEIERDFWREGSQHFDLAYDGDRSEILHASWRLLEELEAAYYDFTELFGVLPVERGRGRIQVVLYRREGFDTLTGLGEWAGGAFDGTVRVPVEDLTREERNVHGVLRHELAHVFVLEAGGGDVPGWLNEGLAQWLEPDRARALERARQTLEGSEPFPLAELETSPARWDDPERIARAYAQSLLVVDFLVESYGERLPFDLVSDCKQGKAPAVTFEQRTRVPLVEALGDLAGPR
jgi:tetratricopeptide (TPR) repeat protein